MQLFYSGAILPDKVQSDPSKSLGGFISASQIANGGLNNVFPPISRNQVRDLTYDVRLIVLKNTTGATVTNVKIYTARGVYSTYNIAGVLPAVDACTRQVFETIQNGNTLPYQATLTSHEGVGNAITAASLANNALVGIWIQRVLDPTQFTQLDGLEGAADMDCQTLATLLPNPGLNTTTVYDEGQLVIAWD